MLIDLAKYLTVALILFLIGISGIILNRKNIIVMLMSIELILDDVMGQLFAILILTVAAAESAIGLAILVVYYRVRGSVTVENIHLLRG